MKTERFSEQLGDFSLLENSRMLTKVITVTEMLGNETFWTLKGAAEYLQITSGEMKEIFEKRFPRVELERGEFYLSYENKFFLNFFFLFFSPF